MCVYVCARACVCVQDSVLIVLICIIKRIKDLVIFKDLLGAGTQISAVFFLFLLILVCLDQKLTDAAHS